MWGVRGKLSVGAWEAWLTAKAKVKFVKIHVDNIYINMSFDKFAEKR
jgi:hypothetical protein